MLKLFLPVIIGYLIGSIPFGYIAGKLLGIDIRKVGSGNIGATNTFRALGAAPAIAVFLLDLLKGTLSVYVASLIASDATVLTQETVIVLSGLAAVTGHMFPVYLGFKGGKGSATSLGVLLGISPDLFMIAMIYAAISIAITRYVSFTSITGVLLLSALMYLFHKPAEYLVLSLIVAVLVIIRHIPNIKRLVSGTEPKVWGGK